MYEGISVNKLLLHMKSQKYFLLEILSCSFCIGAFLLISKIKPSCCVDWISSIGSNSLFLLLCYIIATIPSLKKTIERTRNEECGSSLAVGITHDILSFIWGFVVFFIGVSISTFVQRINLDTDIYPAYLDFPLSYRGYLVNENYFIYYLLVITQYSILSGLISLLSTVVYIIVKSVHVAMIIPIVIIKLEDLLFSVFFGTNSGTYYFGSFYMLSLGSVKYKLSDNVHFVRIVMSLLIFAIILLTDYFYRTWDKRYQKYCGLREAFTLLFVGALTTVLIVCVLRGVRLFISDSDEQISFFFISHMFDNTHFLFFLGMLFFMALSYDFDRNNDLKLRFVLRIGLFPALLYLWVVCIYVVLMNSHISFNNDWGRVIHTLSYNPPLEKYDFIVLSNQIIEQIYSPIDSMIKSFVLVISVFLMIYLIYVLFCKVTNEIVATVLGFIPIVLVSSGELFNRWIWLYFTSPLSWTRLSLCDETDNILFSYPNFFTKVLLIMSINVLLIIILVVLFNRKSSRNNKKGEC